MNLYLQAHVKRVCVCLRLRVGGSLGSLTPYGEKQQD